MSSEDKIFLFHYEESIYSHRVLWYLWLRGLPYDECIQPAYMPRPDLELLGISYRRIPICAIGRDIYCDSSLIIQKLEERFPNSSLSCPSPFAFGIRHLFQNWTIDGGIFAQCVRLIPFWSAGLFQDEKFLDDRQKLMGGRRLVGEQMRAGRPEALVHLRQVFEVLESTFLEDGRGWILGTQGPTVADVDAVWPLQWVAVGMEGALDGGGIDEKRFPKTWAWIRRFMDEVKKRRRTELQPERLSGEAVMERLMKSTESKARLAIDPHDPSGLKSGDYVEVYASDYGADHRDCGRLVGLGVGEVIIQNSKGLNLHFPRWNFRMHKAFNADLITASEQNAPKMRLIYHHGSPYTRKVFMLALELKLEEAIELEKVVVCPVPYPGWSDNNEEVAVFNPMAKIPCLVSADVPDGIFDSRTICDYLESLVFSKMKKDSRYWQRQTLHACADGIMDAAVLIVYEKRIRAERGLKMNEWIEGQQIKMLRGLDRFEAAASGGVLVKPSETGPASAAEIAVAAAIAMTDQMNVSWRSNRPKLVEWFRYWEQRRSFKLTPPDREWISGKAARHSANM